MLKKKLMQIFGRIGKNYNLKLMMYTSKFRQGWTCIIQEKVPLQELVEETTEGKDVNRALEQPLVIKKKKKKCSKNDLKRL